VWYIDSWAVFDGLAFASERPPDSIDARATVFLSVPDLEPIPIGRISTALRAQRSSFQDGFRDDEGEEIGFETLEQVREAVRRAYFGGGLAPTPVGEPGPIDPLLREPDAAPPDLDVPDAGAWYDEVARVHDGDRPGIDCRELQDAGRRRRVFETLHAPRGVRLLHPLLRAFGEATVLELVRVAQRILPHPRVRLFCTHWLRALWRLGLWPDDAEHWRFLERARLAAILHDLGWVPGSRAVAERESFNTASLRRDLLFHVPCPLRPDWSPHIQTLSHKLLLPLCVRGYFRENRALPELVPLLLCALVVVNDRAVPATALRWRDADHQRLLGQALSWLLDELPALELPAVVERHLERFAFEQLRRNPPRAGLAAAGV
jgi:hypothetical protein